MADKLQNEVEIELGGQVRTMRATFACMRAIERDLNTSIIKLITQQFALGEIGVNQAAVIIFHGLRGFEDERLTLEQVGEAIMEQGLMKIGVKVMDFVGLAVEGVSLGKPKAA